MPEPADLTSQNEYYPLYGGIFGEEVDLNNMERAILIIEEDSRAVVANMRAQLQQLRAGRANSQTTALMTGRRGVMALAPAGRSPKEELALDIALAWLFQDQINAALSPQGQGALTLNHYLDGFVRSTHICIERLKARIERMPKDQSGKALAAAAVQQSPAGQQSAASMMRGPSAGSAAGMFRR